MTLLSAHLWLRAVRGTMAQLPTIVATFRFRTVILHVAFFETSAAYLRFRTIRSNVAFLSAVPALVTTSSTPSRALPSHMTFLSTLVT